jgi:GH15 family glucan-1,4-alpha-glucosidase
MMHRNSISNYALLSDCHSAALVSKDGSIDWLCFPRFDSPSVFARLLDNDAGYWTIRPTSEAEVSRRYLDQTLVLETALRTPTGEAVLTDAMALGGSEGGHQLGAQAPHAILRQVSCTQGQVEFEFEYVPRPEYGLIEPLLSSYPGGLRGSGGAYRLVLSSTVALQIIEGCAKARFTLQAGQVVSFALQYSASFDSYPDFWDEQQITRRLNETRDAWQSWSDMHQSYDGPWRDLVWHSGRVLQGLTYHPTGAIVAAPTTSLPESIGGDRNWDYRFTWVRDASLTMEALWVAACPYEADKFFNFLAETAPTQLRRGSDLQIMFGIAGEHDLTERNLPHLSGWRGSKPVRIGNDAWNQKQLDVYGALMGAAHRLQERLTMREESSRQFLVDVADAAMMRWNQRDHGIWEIRGEPRDFLYSKLMCWVALDRAIGIAPLLNAQSRLPDWKKSRDQVRKAILEEGWNPKVGAFTQVFGGEALDASNLMISIVGFLPGDDPRILSTIRETIKHLKDERGLIYRYRVSDGLAGDEGSFLLCTFWLAHAQALAGEIEDAKKTFEVAASFVNDVGLLSEEVDTQSGELIGNFPQAYSHIGLVNAAWAIAQAEQGIRKVA